MAAGGSSSRKVGLKGGVDSTSAPTPDFSKHEAFARQLLAKGKGVYYVQKVTRVGFTTCLAKETLNPWKKVMILLMVVVFVASIAAGVFAKGKKYDPEYCFNFICLCRVDVSGVYDCHWKVCCEYPDGTVNCFLDMRRPCTP